MKAQTTRNAALRNEARTTMETARRLKDVQMAADRSRIEMLAQEQAAERVRRGEIMAKIADEKARMIAATIEREQQMRLKAEEKEKEEKAMKEQQHQEMREKSEISRAARQKAEA